MKLPSIGTILGTACLITAFAAPTTMTRYEVDIVDIVDGDTYKVRPVTTTTIRLSNADTWESRKVRRTGSESISVAEIQKGLAAKKFVEDFLKGKKVWIQQENGKTDSFGRTLCKVIVWDGVEEVDLGEWLKVNGHTRTNESSSNK